MRDFDVLVINLEGSDERLESVRHMLDREQIAWRRMPAVDGRHGMQEGDYDYDESAAIIRHDRPLNTGEIGCYLSHIKALRMFLAGEAACAVVLEDDIDIPSGTFENLKAIAAKLDEFYGDKWDCVNFGSAQRPQFKDTGFTENGIEVRRSTYMPLSTLGIMWTRSGAEAYLNSRKFAVLWIRKCARTLRDAGGPLSPLTPLQAVWIFQARLPFLDYTRSPKAKKAALHAVKSCGIFQII